MKDMESKTYVRITADQLHKGCGSVCLVGRVQSYAHKTSKVILQTSQQPNASIEVILGKVDKESQQLLLKGVILQVRGFGIDNKKLTCQYYNIFEGDLDLSMYNQTVRLMNMQFRALFLGE